MRRKTQLDTQDVISGKIALGFGQGTLVNYIPWHRVGDFRSKGEQSIVHGIKISREHHYFSNIEYRHHLVAEFSPSVVDIREQYPILPIEDSLQIAEQWGIEHPAVSGVPKVLTLDCLLTIQNKNTDYLVARSIKVAKDLADERVQAKLELERRVCQARKIPWELLTEKELTVRMELNLIFLSRWNKIERPPPRADQLNAFLISLSSQDFLDPLGLILEKIAKDMNVARNLAIWLFQYFAWHGDVQVDIFSPILLTKPHLALRMNKGTLCTK